MHFYEDRRLVETENLMLENDDLSLPIFRSVFTLSLEADSEEEYCTFSAEETDSVVQDIEFSSTTLCFGEIKN